MNSSDILSSIIDAKIALTGKGYPDHEIWIDCSVKEWRPNKPWAAYLRIERGIVPEPGLNAHFPSAEEAVDALKIAVAKVPQAWTHDALGKTLGIIEYAEAAE